MSVGDHSSSRPFEVELDRVFLSKGNAFRISLQLEDGASVILDFEPESDGHRRIIDALTRVTTQALSNLGGTGVVITGMTDADDEPSEDEGS